MLRRVCFVLVVLLAGLVRADITVSAAISLKESLTEIAGAYEKKTGEHVTLQFAASGLLAAQIRQGAPVDLFISAARKQVDELAGAGLVDAASVRVVAGNSLVLIVPSGASDVPKGFAELADPRIKRIAVGDRRTVPAGEYAMQVLGSLKLTDRLRDRLIQGINVRQVLSYVERGEVDAGIVYKTDVMESGDKVRVVATAGENLHEPIELPAAIVSAAAHREAAARFLEYLGSEAARQVLSSRGFSLPPRAVAK